MNIDQLLSAPEESLALEVLRQAVHDLRRYRDATGGLERELYRDAYGWITASDLSWPYSFVNICKLLDVPPEMLRAELLADMSLSWLACWCKAGARLGRVMRAALSHGLKKPLSAALTPQLTHS